MLLAREFVTEQSGIGYTPLNWKRAVPMLAFHWHDRITEPVIVLYLQQQGHDGPVSLHWLIHEIPSYQTLQYLGTGLKHKTPNKD